MHRKAKQQRANFVRFEFSDVEFELKVVVQLAAKPSDREFIPRSTSTLVGHHAAERSADRLDSNNQ